MTADKKYIIALDQGTSSSRAILYDLSGREVANASRNLSIAYPQDAWVEQCAEEIWSTEKDCLDELLELIQPEEVAGIAITNQRETVIAWNPDTGEVLAPAIVWQCRRSGEICQTLKEKDYQQLVRDKTGLVIDAYFSGTKIAWMLDNITGLKQKALRNKVIFGTVDSWLIYNLSRESSDLGVYTEPSNASRTMLYNIRTGCWDKELAGIMDIPISCLGKVVSSTGPFPSAHIKGCEIPILAVLGDQQASLYGLDCLEAGLAKCTFGTGAFMLINGGSKLTLSERGLVSTIAWQIDEQTAFYATEGSVFMAGALIQWLRDGLQLISSAAESEELAASVSDSGGLVVVPAFTGLGAPHWDDSARGLIIGLTRDSSKAHIVRASLEAVAHQVADLLEAAGEGSILRLKIDGGMSQNKQFAMLLSEICNLEVAVSPKVEATAFGVARMAAKVIGADTGAGGFSLGCGEQVISPSWEEGKRKHQRSLWVKGVERAKAWS